MQDPMEVTREWQMSDAEFYDRLEDERAALAPRSIEDSLNDLTAELLRKDVTETEKAHLRVRAKALQVVQQFLERRPA